MPTTLQATTSPGPRRGPLAGGLVVVAAGAAGALVVVAAGAAGWLLAGSPPDGAGTVPPPCPVLSAGLLGTGRGGVADRIVPVPLPQPRGPVAVRICAYPSGADGTRPVRDVALDPPRTAELAGVLNTPGPRVRAVTGRPPECAAGPVTVLMFRYTQGAPLVAEVDGGPCALVTTSARVEQGRSDVVRSVAAALGGATG